VGKEPMVIIEEEGVWAPEEARILWIREKEI
jgi:hypothetical protein